MRRSDQGVKNRRKSGKKFICLLSAFLLLGALTACGNGQSSQVNVDDEAWSQVKEVRAVARDLEDIQFSWTADTELTDNKGETFSRTEATGTAQVIFGEDGEESAQLSIEQTQDGASQEATAYLQEGNGYFHSEETQWMMENATLAQLGAPSLQAVLEGVKKGQLTEATVEQNGDNTMIGLVISK
ncbi:MAG: hypothetical protein Q4C25_06965, partial [Bacillota bacterium]|nr:hypothetical protein [Bacillota bacterium]